MIISHIIGGLGNQMFQYAAGRALAQLRGQPFKLDISGFTGYGLHQGFEINRVFNCATPIASRSDLRSILGWQSFAGIRRVLARPGMEGLRCKKFIAEPHFHYWPGIRDVPNECYLRGYWQSEKYFQEIVKIIRNDFTFKNSLQKQNIVVAEKIGQVNGVSLHVRRGDYVTDPSTKTILGLCSLEYYKEAVQYISERIDQPYFFVFSDDISWVKEHLKVNFPCQYVDHNKGTESYCDMQLMSLCKHHIIANSSFSWWGAWLNPNTEKIVIAPQNWFVNDSNVKDLLPTGWVTL